MKEDKTKKIAEYVNKGVEWCANQLYLARKQRSEADQQCRNQEYEIRTLRAKVDNDLRFLERANEAMADVLRDNGIRPTRLRITYLDADCENCPDCGEYDGEWNCIGCGEVIGGSRYFRRDKKVTESMAFYIYKIDNGILQGITGYFEESKRYELLKVVDERTGEIIYEWEKKEEEDES